MKKVQGIMYAVILVGLCIFLIGINGFVNKKSNKIKEENFLIQGMVNPLKWPDLMVAPTVEGDKVYLTKTNLKELLKDSNLEEYAVMVVEMDSTTSFLNFVPEDQKNGITSDFTAIRDNLKGNKYEVSLYFKNNNLVYVKATAVQ